MITVEEAKKYLRVDSLDEDDVIAQLISAAEDLCADVARLTVEELMEASAVSRAAVMYALAYMYEHREEADFHELTLTLRSLLFGIRGEGF